MSLVRRRTGNYNVFELEKNWKMDITTAAKDGRLDDVIKWLEIHGSRDTTKLNQALYKSALYGHAEVMDFLLEAGGDVNARDSGGSTLLFNVVLKGFPECANVLLERGADINAQNEKGDTVLHVVCQECNDKCLFVILIRNDVDLDIQNKAGLSPLMVAAKFCFILGVASLIDKGCDVNLVSKSGKTAVIYCLGKGIPLQHDQGRAIDKSRKYSCLEYLVRANADINFLDREGFGPLHYAVKADSIDSVRLLISENCNLNQRGFFRQVSPPKAKTFLCRGDSVTPVTPFLLSVYYGNLAITKFLVKNGCEYYNCEFVMEYLTDEADSRMLQYLVDAFDQVRSLQKLCIMSIRQRIGVDIEKKVSRLNIPSKLKRDICEPGEVS